MSADLKPDPDSNSGSNSDSQRPLPKVHCPRCREYGDWFAAAWGPFCSKRCKLIDLGQWLDEEHRVSRPLSPADFEGYENLPPELDPDRPE